MADKLSLVLITVDCLRADHCGFYGYSRPTTPFLDSLAPESFVVPAAIATGAPTYYSLPGIQASRMPLALGRDVVGLAPGESTLATLLRDSGYATAAFSAGNPYISSRFGYDQGFDLFRAFLDLSAEPPDVDLTPMSLPSSTRGKLNQAIRHFAGALGLGAVYNELYFRYCMQIAPPAISIDALRRFPDASVLVEQAQAWLASIERRPFFLWLHFMDPHSPYYPPPQAYHEMNGTSISPSRARYLNQFWNRSDLTASRLRSQRDQVVRLYDAGIRWIDSQIARFVSALGQMRRWDDCVFALTADHGEEFLDHGRRYHAPLSLNEEIVRAPLLLRVPGVRPTKVPASPMSHLHLAPTLLAILGEQPASTFQGRSLWTNLQQGAAWSDPAIIECARGCANPFRPAGRIAPRLLAARDSRFKLVLRMEPGAANEGDGQIAEEIYDLEADPAEMRPNVNGPVSSARKRLLLAAHQHMQRSAPASDVRTRLRARLRDLRSEIMRREVAGHELQGRETRKWDREILG